MKEIISPVSRYAIISELKAEAFLNHTSKGSNHLYLVDHRNAPNIVREIGRLREEAFRTAGGGTGKELDLDQYDLSENHPYQQLVVWDPEDQEILAGYRLQRCIDGERDEDGRLKSPTSKLFELSDKMVEEFLPVTIELGRSFVQPKYQRTAARKGLFALDNLWEGLASVMIQSPELEYMFGKVTMYPHYEREARNIILAFMRYFFPDPDQLVRPRTPLVTEEELSPYFNLFNGLAYKQAHKVLSQEVKKRGETIPPLINSYMSLSTTMRSFGTSENPFFGSVEETGILIRFEDIDPARKERYIKNYQEHSSEYEGPLYIPSTGSNAEKA
ncbi:GNAT family N-acetyltransferase [Croceimicrobium hydrocarbonivorans]|uniref:GNAT family N-acetyltransferase n=1 Tax=Croceimicrobium hydrocarbonivorans TaxID=2761580 RepID=A0A7H0VGM5_9FLAO|nr:GNAT family N-acetyltransferase [Croceimicrobium hydrocarbonivorans]QNR24873.1 GNAT family N-acetyltransferase [Croceimicrobium hydrocarbonivorans]